MNVEPASPRDAAQHAAELLELGDAFLELDREWRIIRVNRNQERLSRQPRSQTLGRSLWEIWPESAHPGTLYWREYHRCMDERVPVQFQDYFAPLDLWTDVTAYPTTAGIAVFFRDVTGYKRAEARAVEALRASEERFRALFEDAAVGMVEVDEADRFVAVNARFCDLLGYARDELLGKTLHELTAPEDRAITRDLNARAHRGELRVFDYEKRYLRRDGARVWVHVNVAVVRDAAGRFLRAVATAEDVGDRKRTEQALRESEERYRLVHRATHDVVWDWDLTTGRLTWSDAIHAVFGWRRDDVRPDLSWWDASIHPEDRERVTRSLRDAVADPSTGSWSAEYRFRHGAGHWVYVLDRGHVIRDAAGCAVRMIGSLLDLTERRRAEEALRRSEAQLRGLADAMPQLVWTNRLDGSAEYYNRPWCEYTGTTLEDAAGDSWTRLLHPDDVARTLARWHRSLAAGEPYEVEYRLRSARDGRYRWFLARALPVRDEAGGVVRWFGTCTDIDEQKRVQADLERAQVALRRTEEQLREEHRRKDDFLGMLSHEMRNPLAPIRNALYILDRAEPTGEQARRAKEVASRQLAHITRLVDDLLDVTRIARGKIELRRVDLDLAALARRTADDYRALMQARGLDLVVDVPHDAPLPVDGDETRLAQVLGNLLSNAVKFTPAGGRVTLAARAEGGHAVVHVRDTGLGIPPDVLPHVFEPFTQASQTLARSEGGLGLGLALVKGLVALHGGEVTVSRTDRDGTDFAVTLPLARPASDARTRAASGRSGGAAARRVLVVDDNHDAADTLAELVDMLGHEVDVAYDGPAALALARERDPDLVLCDIGLPGMDGYEVARRLRAAGARNVRLVALSGYAQPEDVARALEAGFDAHVAKPPDPERLEALLATRPSPADGAGAAPIA